MLADFRIQRVNTPVEHRNHVVSVPVKIYKEWPLPPPFFPAN